MVWARWLVAASCFAVACGSREVATEHASAPSSVAVTASVPSATASVDPRRRMFTLGDCSVPGVRGGLRVSEYELACPTADPCTLSVPIVLVNCSNSKLVFEHASLRFGADPPVSVRLYPPLALDPVSEGFSSMPVSAFGLFDVEVQGEGAPPGEPSIARFYGSTGPAARKVALDACKACNGSYGRHGLVGLEGCLCMTPDAGRECRDGEDCTGSCLFDHMELVDAGKRLGRPVGRCARAGAVFGCYVRIPRGASKEPPRPMDVPLPKICVD